MVLELIRRVRDKGLPVILISHNMPHVFEIADRMGVTRNAVDKWRARDPQFPAPRWTVGGRPAWDWSDVASWAEATGRA